MSRMTRNARKWAWRRVLRAKASINPRVSTWENSPVNAQRQAAKMWRYYDRRSAAAKPCASLDRGKRVDVTIMSVWRSNEENLDLRHVSSGGI